MLWILVSDLRCQELNFNDKEVFKFILQAGSWQLAQGRHLVLTSLERARCWLSDDVKVVTRRLDMNEQRVDFYAVGITDPDDQQL